MRRPGHRGLWSRFVWSIAGPAQLGDLKAPIRPSAPDTDVCRRCGELMSTHDVVHAKGNTLLKCQTAGAGAATER